MLPLKKENTTITCYNNGIRTEIFNIECIDEDHNDGNKHEKEHKKRNCSVQCSPELLFFHEPLLLLSLFMATPTRYVAIPMRRIKKIEKALE